MISSMLSLIILICQKSNSLPTCPPLNTNNADGGRCGPLFGGVRCNQRLRSYAVYCNSQNGWCGTTNAHRDAQPTEDKYDFNPTSCAACAENYIGQDGDIPGWGSVDGVGSGMSVANCQQCADSCSSKDSCKSYECSSTELKCNLNLQAAPSQGSYKDYAFCVKDTLIHTVHGLKHFGAWYPVDEYKSDLQYIQGTDTNDNLRSNTWPLKVTFTDRFNERHQIELSDKSAQYTMYFPVTSEIIWHHNGGQDRTGLDAETKWAQVTFRFVDGGWFSSHGIRVEVQGYKYSFNTIYANDWEQVTKGVALGKDVTSIISNLASTGLAIYGAVP